MSDLMLKAVLRMPYEMAMADELSRRQFYDRAQQALDLAESLQAHDDEVLERAAKVAMDMPMKADEIHEYRFSDDSKAIAWDIYHAIRVLKEVK